MTNINDYAGSWTIDPTHSRLGFEARHAVITKVRGHFSDFEGTLVIDPADLAHSSAEVSAAIGSVDTGNADRDGHLRSPDFFDAENNPTLTFVATSIQQNGDGFTVSGDLTIKGVTHNIELALELTGTSKDPFGNERAGFEGTGELSRKDFGLTWNVALETGGFLVSDNIKLQLDISAIKNS